MRSAPTDGMSRHSDGSSERCARRPPSLGPMADPRTVRVLLETTPKKTFATAVDWPGWSRSAKTAESAIETLLAYRDRYMRAVADAGEGAAPASIADVIETAAGDGGTAYGGPSRIA